MTTLSRDQREQRVAEIQRWMQDQQDEFGNDEFTPEAQRAWDNHTGELARHQTILNQGADLDQRLRDAARNGGQFESADHRIGDHGSTRGESPLVRLSDGKSAAVERGKSFASHPVVADHVRANKTAEETMINYHGSFGNLIRSMSTSSGSAVVPTIWASNIIDRARILAQVINAGAQTVPMDANVVKIGRLTTDPTAAFRAEGSTVTASDPVFDNVTLTARTLSALVVGSMEWFQDAPNVDQIVSEAIAKAIALTLDQQALFGGVIAGGETGATGFNTTFATPPNPKGILASLLTDASSSVLGGAANGTPQTAGTFWNEIIDTALQPTLFNEQPTAVLWNPIMVKRYAEVYDTTQQPLNRPPVLDQFKFLTTNQIIAGFTQGTATTSMTDVFAGNFSQLIIGQRLGFTVQTLTERYAELGQIGIIAHWRGDIGLTRPRAFSVYRYLKSN